MLRILIFLFLSSSLCLQNVKGFRFRFPVRKPNLQIRKSGDPGDQVIRVDSEQRKVPKTAELAKFALPTLGIWLLQPILSLIDTSVVGISKTATIAQLAALGPGIAWIDSTSYLFQFMGIATTNLFANALSEKNEKKCEKVLSHSIFTALFFGVLLFAIQFGLANTAVSTLSGTAVDSIPYGVLYSKIRALAAPFAIPTIVAQAAFLASKDAITPLKAVLVGAVVNLVGDILLVTVGNMGLAGAAIATALSQVSGALFLVFKVFQLVGKSKSNDDVLKGRTTWSLLKEKISIPNVGEVKNFLSFCGPLFAVLLVKTFLWTYTTFACSASGAIDLAAHQISINLFLFFCIFGDVVSQLSQTYLPYYLTSNKSSNKNKNDSNTPENEKLTISSLSSLSAVYELIKRVFLIGAWIGVFNSFCYQIIRRYGYSLFTTSGEIMGRMRAASGFLSLATLPHAMMLGMEGLLIASRDFKFQSLTYLILGGLFIIYQTNVRMNKWGIVGVWAGTAMFQWARITIFSLRVKHILKESEKRLTVK